MISESINDIRFKSMDLNQCSWGFLLCTVMPQNPFLRTSWLILGQAGYFCTRPRRNTNISVPIALIGNIHYRRLRPVIAQNPFLLTIWLILGRPKKILQDFLFLLP